MNKNTLPNEQKERIIALSNAIYKTIKIAHYYLTEWEKIMLQGNDNNGEIFNKYYYPMAYIRKAYLETGLLTLGRLFDGYDGINFKSLRECINSLSTNYTIPSFEDFDKKIKILRKKLKIIRDKSIAHSEGVNPNIFYKEAKLPFKYAIYMCNSAIKYLNFLQKYIEGKNYPNLSENTVGVDILYSLFKDRENGKIYPISDIKTAIETGWYPDDETYWKSVGINTHGYV